MPAGEHDWKHNDNADLTLRLHSTTDARVWAEEWVKVAWRILDRGAGNAELLLEEDWMIGWFANAIEVGREAGQRKTGAAMKLDIKVSLHSGGYVLMQGDNLNAEEVNEVFALLAGHTISSEKS
jgi:hypothetical protein